VEGSRGEHVYSLCSAVSCEQICGHCGDVLVLQLIRYLTGGVIPAAARVAWLCWECCSQSSGTESGIKCCNNTVQSPQSWLV
jgi:hypothetical protein